MIGSNILRGLFLKGEDAPPSPAMGALLAENARLVTSLKAEMERTRHAFYGTTPDIGFFTERDPDAAERQRDALLLTRKMGGKDE